MSLKNRYKIVDDKVYIQSVKPSRQGQRRSVKIDLEDFEALTFCEVIYIYTDDDAPNGVRVKCKGPYDEKNQGKQLGWILYGIMDNELIHINGNVFDYTQENIKQAGKFTPQQEQITWLDEYRLNKKETPQQPKIEFTKDLFTRKITIKINDEQVTMEKAELERILKNI